jgi:hypothetical protein
LLLVVLGLDYLSSSDYCLRDYFLKDSVGRVCDSDVTHLDMISALIGDKLDLALIIVCPPYLHLPVIALDGFKFSDVFLTAAKKVLVAVNMIFFEIDEIFNFSSVDITFGFLDYRTFL